MKQKTVCIGGGGHAKILIDVAHRGGAVEVVAITDPDPSKRGESLSGIPILGGDELLKGLLAKGIGGAIIGVGSVRATPARRRLFTEAERLGFEMVNVIDPSTLLSKWSRLGKGIAILPGVIVNAGTTIGNAVTLYSGVIIEHDAVLRDHVQVSPGAIVAGGVELGEGSFLGAGSCVIQGVKIGRNVTVGAGAVVLRDVPDGATVVGVPAKPVISVSIGE